MTLNPIQACDVLLMAMAVNFDLSSRRDRKRSAVALSALFQRLIEPLAPQVVFEIGAFEAGFSQEARRLLPDAQAIAFEANPHNYERFAPDLGDKGIDYVHAAVAERTGTANFYLQTKRQGRERPLVTGSNSLLRRTDPTTEHEAVSVPTVSLDEFCRSRGIDAQRSVAWIDVEGAVGSLFGGAGESLSSMAAIMVEVEDRRHWDGQWIAKDVISFLCENGFIPIARDFQNNDQYNILFLRSGEEANDRVRGLICAYFSEIGSFRESELRQRVENTKEKVKLLARPWPLRAVSRARRLLSR